MIGKRKVLIVEDENIVQLHLRMLLEELGYIVSGTASTGAEALRSAAADTPHLVLMDVKLPGGRDGIETARELRKQCDPALVFLTAFGDDVTLARAQEVGANGYIVKPFTKPQIRATLSTALNEYQRLRQARESRQSLASAVGGREDAVIVVDAEGFLSFLDPHAVVLTGWSQSEALDRHVLDVVRLRGPAFGHFERLLSQPGEAGSVATPLELELHSRAGQARKVRVEVRALSDTDGTRRGVMLLLRELNGHEPARVETDTGPPHAFGPFGAGTRMAIFSHDTLGLGHLQRCTNIARALTARHPGLSVLLLTGSPAVHRYALPQGVDYIKLPAVRKVASEQYQARTLGMSGEGVLKLRTNLVLHTLQDYAPHVLLVDHAPLGMKGELLATLEWLHTQRPNCIKILGLRDVIDHPDAVKALWREQGTYDTLRKFYDHILIYGSPEVYDLASAYDFPDDLKAKTTYTNYVSEYRPDGIEAEAAAIPTNGKPLVVVTIGGGDGGGEVVIGTFLEMLRRFSSRVGFDSLILTGPFLPAELQERFAKEAQGLPVRILDFVTSSSPYLARADLVISTCGYNTMTQNLGYGRRALVIPRVMHRQEQLIRAQRLAELGLITCLHPDDVAPERLFESVQALLADPAQPLAEARAQNRIRLDGTEQIAKVCAQLTLA